MGHNHLGSLPDTAPWRKVIQLLAEDADVEAIAVATTEAALEGLQLAKEDEGLAYNFWLFTRLVRAARQADWVADLRDEGLAIPDLPTIFDVVAAFTDQADRHMHRVHGRTDLTEMAQLAAVTAITRLLGRKADNLFGTTAAEVKNAARQLSTQKGFGTLAHEWFANFTERFLGYHLGRELSHHVGGNARFASPDAHTEFNGQLATHAREAAGVMQHFAADYYHKHNFEGGITPGKAKKFCAHAVTKLQDELTRRGARRG